MLDQAVSPKPVTNPVQAKPASAPGPPASSAARPASGARLRRPEASDALTVKLARAVAARSSVAHEAPRVRALQRAIDQQAFARLDHSLARAPGRPIPVATLKRDADQVDCIARHVAPPAAGLELSANTAGAGQTPAWTAPAPILPATLQASYSWPGERIDYQLPAPFATDMGLDRRQTKERGADQINQVGPGGDVLTITEFAGDELALVHYTTGGGSPPHLTVENAHISEMHYLNEWRTIAGFNKGAKKKPDHEDFMAGYKSARTDNLNFFSGGALNLSLATYLRVIRHAMDHIPGVPPVYGEEVIRSANAMAASSHLNPAQLFLPEGQGMERHLFRAALNMDKMGLIALPPAIVTAFAGFDAAPKPKLTDSTGTVIGEGEVGWNVLERDVIKLHLPALLGYLNTF